MPELENWMTPALEADYLWKVEPDGISVLKWDQWTDWSTFDASRYEYGGNKIEKQSKVETLGFWRMIFNGTKTRTWYRHRKTFEVVKFKNKELFLPAGEKIDSTNVQSAMRAAAKLWVKWKADKAVYKTYP